MNKNPYIKTDWKDHIVDTVTGDTIQEGTRFTASRANNIEDGIYNAHDGLLSIDDEMTKLRIQLEMLGRAPTNNGTFFDPLDGTEGQAKALKLLTQSGVSQNALEIGAIEITVDKPENFAIGQEIIILDEEGNESKVITNIVGNKLTVSALVNVYKKGAYVARSSVVRKGNKLSYIEWGTYNINIKEVI